MSGTINAGAGPSGDQPPAGGGLSNPLLRQAEQKLETNLTAAVRANYDKIVVAGLHTALAKGADGGMASLIHAKDPVASAAQGAVALVLTMQKQAKGVMPVKAMIPAGMTLLLHALDFLDRAGVVKIAEPQLVQATTTFTNLMFHKLGVTPQMLQRLTGRVKQLSADPAVMQKIGIKAGTIPHPQGVTPTPLPGGMINGGGS